MEISDLVREVKLGSAAAQRCLFDLLANQMLMLCRRYLKSRELAEEVMLDGFYKFFKGMSVFTYEGDVALKAWLTKIMVNECLMTLRKRHVFTIVTDAEAVEIPWDDDVFGKLAADEIFYLLTQLPVGYRTVFNLYEIEGRDHREIAESLGISIGTSKSQLSKGKALLQKMLLQNGTEYVKRNVR